MAPIHGAAVGVSPQAIEDDRLRNLRDALLAIEIRETFHQDFASPDEVVEPFDVSRLVSELDPWQTWVFEEQVSPSIFLAIVLKWVYNLPCLTSRVPSILAGRFARMD